ANERAKAVLRTATLFWVVVFLNVATITFLGAAFPRLIDLDNWWAAYWLMVAIGLSLFLSLGLRRPVGQRRTAAVLLMTADVLMFILSYGDTRPMVAIYPRWPIIDYIREHNPDGHRVFDAEGQSAGDWCFLGPGSPVASVYGVPSILGFNPLDVARYRQFLAVIAGHREPLQAFSSDFAHPVGRGCQVYDRRLVDLAGVRYCIQSPRFWYGNTVSEVDSLPWASSYNFLGKGVEDLPQTSLLENLTVMPRAFVVNEVVPQEPEHRVIAQ